MTQRLHTKLLGGFSLVFGDRPVTTINSPRMQALLAYLMLHHETPHPRYYLAFLFWPDSSEAQAYTNLRQLLHGLRRALPQADRFIHATAKTLQWQTNAPFSLDAAEFERMAKRAAQVQVTGNPAAARAALEEAVALYGGDLLPSCYDEWLLAERERLRWVYSGLLEDLIQLQEDQRDYSAALRSTERLLHHDPLRESTYQRLMRLHALNNNRTGALRVYHTCATVLQRELGVEPSPATHSVYERLLSMDSPASASSQTPTATLVGRAELVGRRQEWGRLLGTWHRAADGSSLFALLCGEAGIGKTRLAEELRDWVGQQGYSTAMSRCYAAEGRLAYAPVIDLLRGDPLRASLDRLSTVWLGELARLLPELLVDRPDLAAPGPLIEGWQRQRLFEALARAVLAASQPLLLIIDDLQWCDQETLEWLHYLLRFDRRAHLLVVGTARIEEIGLDHPLRSLLLALRATQQVAEIDLGPLSAEETRLLVERVSDAALSTELAGQVYQETEGNPLFIVETMRARLEQHPGGLVEPQAEHRGESATERAAAGLSPRVQAVIAARLAELSPLARGMVGLAATIGREFTFAVLAHAGDWHEDELVRGLDELWQRRIVREHGVDGYDFSHDKIREVAYAEVSSARRRLFHRRVAEALEEIYANDQNSVSARIAAHYEQAGMILPAIRWYQGAAEVVQRVYANRDALSLLTTALELLKTLPESRERNALELQLQMAIGVPLVALRGYAASEVRAAYRRARELCRQLGVPLSPPILRALAIAALVRGDLQQADEFGQQLLLLAREKQEAPLLDEAHYVLGVTLFWRGAFSAARDHLERAAIAHYDSRQSATHIALYSQDPAVVCLVRLALALWYLGYAEQALAKSGEALVLARRLAHPFSLAYVLHWSACLYNHLRDVDAMQKQVEESLQFSLDQEFAYWSSQGTLLQGWTLLKQGQTKQALAQMQAGLSAFRATETELGQPYHLGLVAEALAADGQTNKALRVLEEALAMVDSRGEYWAQAQLYRLKGEILLAQRPADHQAAVTLFAQSLAVARQQSAKWLELRAAVSLFRLRRLHGEPAEVAEARSLLERLCSWFTEGHDTLDYREAQELLKV